MWVRKWSVRPPGSVQVADELLEETDLGLVCAAFGPVMEGERPWLHRLDRWVFDEGRVTLHESAIVDAFAAGMRLGHADYTYDEDGRVATVEAWHWDPEDPDADRAGVSRRWSVRPVYGADGEMVEVREGPNVTWVRPRRGVSVRSLSQSIEDRLVEAVSRQLAGERLPGPLYCLMLYSSDFSGLEPMLVGGLEARRGYLLAHPPGPMEPPGLDGEAIAEPGLGAGPSEREMLAYPLWNPLDEPRFQTYAAGKEPALVAGIVLDELAGDERFRDQCRQLWAHADAKSGDPIAAFARVLQGAAARLTALEWSKILPTTDDFVVIAHPGDIGVGELRQTLRRSLGPERYRDLQRKGLTP